MTVTLRQLEYFVAVVDEGSFTRAAEILHVTQPGLSHQFQALERELGGPLLERLPRKVRLTPAGRAMLRRYGWSTWPTGNGCTSRWRAACPTSSTRPAPPPDSSPASRCVPSRARRPSRSPPPVSGSPWYRATSCRRTSTGYCCA